MPGLTVSENTWPHVGFSRKRWIRPSSSTMTIPNSSGSGTRVSPTVTSAPLSLWNRTSSDRSISVRASPEILAVAEVVAHHRGEERRGDHGLVEAVLPQQPEHVLHDRPVDHGQHRLWLGSGHRAPAGA